MMHKKLIKSGLLLLLLAVSGLSKAQNTLNYIQEDRLLQKGAELYEKEKYERAQYYFAQIIDYYGDEHTDIKADAEYYSALCAIALFNRDAEDRIAEFIAKYPESPLTRWAYYEMGKFQYRQKAYEDAIVYFEKVWKQHLNAEQKAEFYFKWGYSLFKLERYDEAAKKFYELVNRESKYQAPAIYYYAHLAYQKGKYQTALKRFKSIENDPTFAPIIPYYVIQIYYLQEKYDLVLSYGPELLDSTETKRDAEISRLIGEALYNNDQFEEAQDYLEKYKETADVYTREDIYQLGYVYYMNGLYAQASTNFSDITNAADELTQNAYFHLADCYLKMEEQEQAMQAFEAASQLDFDQEIKEQSLLNYAKLSYELSYSPFNETITAFHNYIENYPNSIHHDEAYSYLVKVYLTSKNYKAALQSLEKIKIKSPEMLAAHQRVAYFRGLELFNNLQFSAAFAAFDIAVKQRAFDKQINALALYWRAEALYRMDNFSKAADSYEGFLIKPGAYLLPEYNLCYYNLGYCFFKQKQYDLASSWFRKFVDKKDEVDAVKYSDALIRTADCFFMLREYSDAISYYDRAVIQDTFDVDYAQFQKGFSYGLLKKYMEKAVVLSALLDKEQSAYAADALYERGRSYVMMDKTAEAIQDFQRLVNRYPSSSYVVKAYLNLGLLHYGADQNELALTAYKNVVEKYPGTAEASDALLGIKNIYVDMNQVDQYFAYAEDKAGSSVTLSEKDSLTYMAAEKIYMSGSWENANEMLATYIEKYPEGRFASNAYFYRGDCLYRLGNKDEALHDFHYIVDKPKSIFTEQALVYAAEIESDKGNHVVAYDLFNTLENQAEVKANLLVARLGMMRNAFADSSYQNAIDAGKRVLMTDKVSEEEERETRLIMAKSYVAQGLNDLGITQYRILALDIANVEGAEAKYQVANMLFLQNELEDAEEQVNDFIAKGSQHQYWLAKSFMLLSDIYVVKENGFKAKAYLQSIISNYGNQQDGIIAEARQKLATIVEGESAQFVDSDQIEYAPEAQSDEATDDE